MKCRYSNCKHGGEVSKEEAVKVGNAYYHQDCLHEKKLKKEIEDYYIQNMPPTTIVILRKVIKQLVEKRIDLDFALFVCKWIKTSNKPIRNPFGLLNYCTNYKVVEMWKKKKVNDEYNKIKSEIKTTNETQTNFKYQAKTKRFTDLI